MKLLIFSFIALACITYSSCDRLSDFKKYMPKVGFAQTYLVEFVENCKTSSCDKNEIYNAKIKTLDCIADIKVAETFCKTFVEHFQQCANPLLTALEECMDTSQKKVPASFVTSLTSLASYLCNTDGEHILELFNPCAAKHVMQMDMKKCADSEKYRPIHEILEDTNSTKDVIEEVCKLAPDTEKCVLDVVNKSCENEMPKDVYKNVIDSVLTPCKK